MRKIVLTPLDWLAPPRCVFCGLRLGDGRVCAGCRDDLPWNRHACPGCAEPAGDAVATTVPCAHCQARPFPWTRCVAPLVYEFPVDDGLKALKFRRCLYYAPAFAELLLPRLLGELTGVDALVPVPLHRFRHLRRGYNQAAEICRPLGGAAGLPVVNAVRRIRPTAAQPGLDRAARRRNLHGAFGVKGSLSCRHPLIVDDVVTTGETCRQLATTLLDAGASEVAVLVVARAPSPA